MGYKTTQIANVFGVSRPTVYRMIHDANITPVRYTNIAEHDLDQKIADICYSLLCVIFRCELLTNKESEIPIYNVNIFTCVFPAPGPRSISHASQGTHNLVSLSLHLFSLLISSV